MSKKLLRFGTVVAAASAIVSLSPAMAQKNKGSLYAFHTRPVIGGCPGLDWHVVVTPDNKIDGFVAWDHKKHMATLDGNSIRTRPLRSRLKNSAGRAKPR